MPNLKPKFNYLSYQNILFALFLVSGAIKFLFVYVDFPIDITLVLFFLISLDIIKNFSLGIKRLHSKGIFFIIIFLLLILISIISLSYSASLKYKYIKVLSFFISFTGFLYPLFIIEFKINFFFKVLLYTIIPATIIFIAAKQIHWYGINSGFEYETRLKASQIQGSYLALSDYLAISSIYMVYKRKYLYCFALLLLIFSLGAKGSLIFTIIILIIWKRNKIVAFKIPRKYLNKIVYTLILVFLSLAFFADKLFSLFKLGFHRFSEFLMPTIDKGPNVFSRLELYEFAVTGIFSNFSSFLFGNGIGSFGILFKKEDVILYPHNIFLEAWFELGIIGLLLTLIFLILPLLLKDHKNVLIKLCAIYIFLIYLKTGSFDGARVLFLIYGCLIFLKEKQIKWN